MTTKFTSGPWLVSPCYLDDYNIANYSVGPLESSDGARFVEDQICQVSSPNEPYYVAKANARLIAAAPDLYEALDSLTGHAVYEGMTESEQQAIESLLAKARGES